MDGLVSFPIHVIKLLTKREQHGEGDIVSRKVLSWWKYNPLLQKPTSLDPVRPWGWYWYYGPDPASGCSYGQYHDEENDFDMITAKDKIVYSPASGKPMQFIGVVPEKEMGERTNKVTGDQFSGCHVACTACQAKLVSDYNLSEMDELHCVKCGELCEVDTIDKKTIKGEKTMSKEGAREQRIQGLKRRIRANILKKRKAEASKENRTKLAGEERKTRQELLAERNRMLRDQRRIKAEEEEKKNADDEELISLDSIMEAMDEEEPVEDEDTALLDDEECDPEEEVCASDDEELEEEFVSDEAVEEPMDEDFGGEELDFSDGLEEEPAVEEPAVEEPVEDVSGEGDSDEYYDLDMVLSMVNKKKARMEKMKKAKKVKAEEEKAPQKPAQQPPVEESEEEESMLDDEEPVEPASEEAVEEPAPKEDMEAMKFEPLASLDSLKGIRKEDIDMALYHEDSENPTWNITIAGVPTARIQLKKQKSPDEIRAVFCSEDYAKDLMVHCEKTGFIQTMNKVHADFWSNHTSNKKIAERFKTEASVSFDVERKKLLATFKQNFRSCMNIVSAGLSKNFYPDMGNSLKEHLFTNLRTVGLPEQTAISVVEKSFAEGAAPYFDALFEKSEEYMNLTPEARKEIAAAISQGSSIKHDSSLENMEPATLSDRVAQASLVANTISGTPLKVTKDVLMDTNEYKAQLRSVWRNK